MYGYCCYQSKTEVDVLKENIEEMKKQIRNIYELLEVLTNESKRTYLMSITVIMFQRKITQRQKQHSLLTKPSPSYRKLEKAMNEAPKEYDQIKRLIEASTMNTDLKTFSNNSLKTADKNVKILPHQKNNMKSKK